MVKPCKEVTEKMEQNKLFLKRKGYTNDEIKNIEEKEPMCLEIYANLLTRHSKTEIDKKGWDVIEDEELLARGCYINQYGYVSRIGEEE